MATRLEHVNLCVRDIDGMTRFLQVAFPDFVVRGSGGGEGQRWVHVGNEDTYFGLSEADGDGDAWVPYTGRPGINHVGFEVDDVASLRQRLRAAGYRDTTVPNDHPARTRVYFNDDDGNDWEFVQYHVDDRAQRHDYSRP